MISIQLRNKMKHLKAYESFSMYRENCDRCGESTNNSTTMSVFNEDVICMSCKAKEKEDPDYDAAVEAEMAALKRGDSNYKGAIPNYKPLR